MLIEFNEKFSVNVKEIDAQHKKLIDNINELYDAISAGEGNEVLDEILDSLLEYTHTHFATEENLMIIHGYPYYEEHKKEHDDLNDKVKNMIKRYTLDNTISMPLKVMKFLRDWLSHHILETDKRYTRFFNEKGIY